MNAPENQNGQSTTSPSENVAAVAAQGAVSAQASEAAAASAGLPVVKRDTVAMLVELGIKANTYGLTKIASGGLICTMDGLTEMQQRVLELCKEPGVKDKVVLQAAAAFAALARAMHGCATAVNADGLAAADKPKRPVRRLAPGSVVTVSPTST